MMKEWYEGLEIGGFRGYLKDFIEQLKEGKLPVDVNTLSCAAGCPLYGALDILSCVYGIINVIHGPIGCAYLLGTIFKIRWGKLHWGGLNMDFGTVSTNFGQKDLILGGEKKLEDTILQVDRDYRPQYIAVLSTCSSGIIGEDIEGIVDPLRPKVKAKILILPTAGCSYRHQGKGYDMGYATLIEELMEEPLEKIPLSVNIVGDKRDRTASKLAVNELKRVLDKVGVKLNKSFVSTGSTIEDIKVVPKAQYDLLYCINSGYHPAKLLKEKYGIPFLAKPLPIGLEVTRRWYLDICDFFNLGGHERAIIEEEYERARQKIEEPMKFLKGKRFGVNMNIYRAFGTAQYAAELGMEVVYLATLWAKELSANEFIRFHQETGMNPYLFIEPVWAEEEAIINQLKPDLFLSEGALSLWPYNSGSEFDGVEQHPSNGFAGAVHLAQRWAKIIKRRPFAKIRQWVELPPHSSKEFINNFLFPIL